MSLSFKPQNAKLAATKRIMRDLKDLDKVPVPGLGVCCPDESNPFLLHCNVLINDGPYRGIMIHLILHIPEDYPLTGPAGNIAPGLEFDARYHAHIHEDHRTCGHSYDKANPAVVSYTEIMSDKHQTQKETMSKKEEERLKLERERLELKRELIERLTCGVTKQNVIENNICLGYPLLIKRDSYGRLWPELILELISYDAYVAEIQKSGGQKLYFYEHSRFRSVTGKDYNHWLPLYIYPKHFLQGRIIIQNGISVIYNGTAKGSKKYDFAPHMALSVLTTLMNKSAVRLFNGEMFESKQAIEAYCHLLRLLMHFIDIYPELEHKINRSVAAFITGLPGRNKKVVPDMGEFLIQIALSTKYNFNDVKRYVYEECFARQIYWIQRDNAIQNLRLDRLYGFPPAAIVEKFQQRLKVIKSIDRYSVLIQAIRLNATIKSPEDMVCLIKRSVDVSNQQGYTSILSIEEQQRRRSNEGRWDVRR
ncbi:unnamed protein product [Rotaria sp. Silwood1]|nr:unnamed protein product [Rotaria sp. Silwood1]